MTQQQIRQQVVNQITSWLGTKEGSIGHHAIIDCYNTYLPRPAGYKMQYTDSWCAAGVSAAAIMCSVTDVVFPECSCPRMINLYKQHDQWRGSTYTPQIADLIMYDWGKDGVADHVGIVTAISGDTIHVIECNKNDSVEERVIQKDYPYILGYCTPNYAAKAETAPANAQEAFFAKIKPYVIADMKATGIPASLTAAQAACESAYGSSGLTVKANNLFGIKAGSGWTGKTITLPTKEYKNGQYVTINAVFRAYDSWADSISDHSKVLLQPRYSNIIGVDYKTACVNVKLDGYATSPTYSDTLIKIIEQYHLNDWDTEKNSDNLANNGVSDISCIKYGDKGEAVKLLQKALINQGYGCGPDGVDGEVGDYTYRAMVMYMFDNRRIQAGKGTLEALHVI